VATRRRRPDRAPAAVQQQSRHRDHRLPQRLDEIVPERLAIRLQANSPGQRESADCPAPLAPRSSAARPQSPRGSVQGHLGFESSWFAQYHSLNTRGALHPARRTLDPSPGWVAGLLQERFRRPGTRSLSRTSPVLASEGHGGRSGPCHYALSWNASSLEIGLCFTPMHARRIAHVPHHPPVLLL
jgi:hypothetical protein